MSVMDEEVEDIVVGFDPADLPTGGGIRTSLRHFLLEQRDQFSKVSFRLTDDRMVVIATPREALTNKERAAMKADIEKVIRIFAQLKELDQLR